jgi:hypothetical protein
MSFLLKGSKERVLSLSQLEHWIHTCNSSFLPQSPVMVAIVTHTFQESRLQYTELTRFFLVTDAWKDKFLSLH